MAAQRALEDYGANGDGGSNLDELSENEATPEFLKMQTKILSNYCLDMDNIQEFIMEILKLCPN